MLSDEGFAIVSGVFDHEEIETLLALLPPLDGAAGTRNLLHHPWCRDLASDARIRRLVEEAIGPAAVPVRGILFDKSPDANWNLGWHQDKKIAVNGRIDAPGYFAWSEKEGVVHCQAPAALLDACVAVRIHLDPCGLDNGPLRVIAGSHRFGVSKPIEPERFKEPVTCVCEVGDVILMKPLTLHASSKAESPRRRRVIHIEYCSATLPGGLEWAYA
ncbi:MAG TPA: phytanoyl-CoA dioxygenase family protein [Fimbriimonadaceae bacterium]|nr:phytanoyl-CoA dioxygenase family protein [Fimbriimonadaceae bacterium]